jgi:hypothetical protein
MSGPKSRGRLRSGFGAQVLSARTTAPSASFGSGEQRPRTRGGEGGCGGGGGLSPPLGAMGEQADSTRPTAPSPGFSKGPRLLGCGGGGANDGGLFAPSSSSASRPPVPGPGAYPHLHAAEAATKRAAPRFVFGQSARDAGRLAGDAERMLAAMGGGGGGCVRAGAGAVGGSANSPRPGAYSPYGALGGRQPTRPSAPAISFGGGSPGRPQSPSMGASGGGVPGVGLYSDGASAAALSLVSTRRCAPAHSFGARGDFSGGAAASKGRAVVAAASYSPAAACLSGTPGPADTAPALAPASARQVLSTRPNAPRAGFGASRRFGGSAAAAREAVPGSARTTRSFLKTRRFATGTGEGRTARASDGRRGSERRRDSRRRREGVEREAADDAAAAAAALVLSFGAGPLFLSSLFTQRTHKSLLRDTTSRPCV